MPDSMLRWDLAFSPGYDTLQAVAASIESLVRVTNLSLRRTCRDELSVKSNKCLLVVQPILELTMAEGTRQLEYLPETAIRCCNQGWFVNSRLLSHWLPINETS